MIFGVSLVPTTVTVTFVVVLPPLLFLAGPAVGWQTLHRQRSVFGGVGECPKCAELLWIGAVPLLTAIFRYCPAYSVIGIRTGH